MNADTLFTFVIIFYSVTNLLSMGLELNVQTAAKALRNIRLWVLIFLLGWVLGPAFALLLIRVIPMHESYGFGLIVFSLAPGAPFLPMMVRIARADMSIAAAILPMAAVGTVVLLPLMTPLMIEGMAVSSWALAKPLLLMVFLPMVIGIAIRVKTPKVADKIFPASKKFAGIGTLSLLLAVLWFYWQEMLAALGSLAVLSQFVFLFGMAVLSYLVSFGLKQGQKSSVCLGITTRNGSAIFAAISAFPGSDPHLLVYSLLTIPVLLVASIATAKVLSRQAPGTT